MLFDIKRSGPGPALIRSDRIAERVKAIGAEIDRDYNGKTIQMVVVLDGAWVFAADLARAIRSNVVVHFVRAASYGSGKSSSGRVRMAGIRELEIADQDVILVEDIIDSGRTAAGLIAGLEQLRPRSLRVVSLLSKPTRRAIDVRIDYLGFEIPNEFVVGYGMDFGQTYRNLPDIRVID